MIKPRERAEKINALLERRGVDYRLNYETVYKDFKERDAYIIRSESLSASPILYCDEGWYQQSDDRVIDFIKTITERDLPAIVNPQYYTSRNYIVEHVYPQLVSGVNKKGLDLHGAVNQDYLDMCLIYYVLISEESGEIQSYKLTKTVLENADLTIEELREYALRNLAGKYTCQTLGNVLSRLTGQELLPGDETGVYVLTTSSGINGAAAILCPEAIEELGNRLGSYFYIIPSSIHEVLAIPCEPSSDVHALKNMIGDVNASVVSPNDILSWSLYISRNGEIEIAV